MDILLIGASGKLGPEIRSQFPCVTAGRSGEIRFDIGADNPAVLPDVDAVIINAACTSFHRCEVNPVYTQAVNADGPIRVGRRYADKRVIFISSESAVMGHLMYGRQKMYAELGLLAVCRPVILRLRKIDDYAAAGKWVASHVKSGPGVYWR